MSHNIVWPDEHRGPVWEYRRDHGRPDFPPGAILILDRIPYPTPAERPTVYLAARLPDDVASRCDFVLIAEHPNYPGAA